MDEEKTKNPILKGLKIIGEAILATLAVIQLFHWIGSWGNDLKATIEYNDFEMPEAIANNFAEAFSSFEGRLNPKELIRDGFFDMFQKDVRIESNAVVSFARELRYNLGIDFSNYKYSNSMRLRGVYRVRLENNGDFLLKDVSLKIPYAKIAQISGEKGETNVNFLSDAVPIGEINSKERMFVTVWTSISPSSYSERDIVLRHSQGIGSISFRSEIGNPWRYMDNGNWIPLLCFPGVFCGMLLIFFFRNVKFERGTQVKQDGEADKPNNETMTP